MQELFTDIGDGHRTRAGSDRFLRPNVGTINNGEKSLRNFGPILWNTMLPDELKRCTSLDIFKEKVKFWVPDMCKCTLCKTYINPILHGGVKLPPRQFFGNCAKNWWAGGPLLILFERKLVSYVS